MICPPYHGQPHEEIIPPGTRSLGEVIKNDFAVYGRCHTALLGCPQDEGVIRNDGRAGARYGPESIRWAFNRIPVTRKGYRPDTLDLGDIELAGTLEETHRRLRHAVRNLLEDGKRVIVLGGGNDISYPDCAALAGLVDDLCVINIDTHYDVRRDRPRNSGTPYRMLIERGLIDPLKFYEIAGKKYANDDAHYRYLLDREVNIVHLESLRRRGMKTTLEDIIGSEEAQAFFWGIDIDSVQSDYAPGVSAPTENGLRPDEISTAAALAGNDPRSRLLEISEVNPVYDIEGRTSLLAAGIVGEFLGIHGDSDTDRDK